MTRSELTRTLMHIERLREASYEAATKREEKRLVAEYGRLSRAIRPYTTGAEKLEEDALVVPPAPKARKQGAEG